MSSLLNFRPRLWFQQGQVCAPGAPRDFSKIKYLKDELWEWRRWLNEASETSPGPGPAYVRRACKIATESLIPGL